MHATYINKLKLVTSYHYINEIDGEQKSVTRSTTKSFTVSSASLLDSKFADLYKLFRHQRGTLFPCKFILRKSKMAKCKWIFAKENN